MRHRSSKLFAAALLIILSTLMYNTGGDTGVRGSRAATSTEIFLPAIYNRLENSNWSMAGANPERTSATMDEVRGKLKPVWYRPIEPYILPRVQVIAAYGKVYVSTARGLYAFGAETGELRWVYPTELPLGHSPTINKSTAYVGGFDRRIHAVDTRTGQPLWTFEAGAGFDTNPLVVKGKLYAGNRDGNFYALYTEGAQAGELAWLYPTQGPIHYSAAYKDGVVYFASDDAHAYAVDADNGQLVWKSKKLPGAGFHSWWPVVYGDWVIFAGSDNYRNKSGPGPGSLLDLTRDEIFPNRAKDPKGTLVGPIGEAPGNWVSGTPTIDTSKSESTPNGKTSSITEYYEQKSWRRTMFVLNRYSGDEYSSDFDHDGVPEYAPILWFGTRTGNRYPPVVGYDGVLYQTNTYMSDEYIPGGQVSGWQIGTPYISIVSSDWGAFDEPHAYSVGGNLIYYKLCCDREVGAADLSIPNRKFADRYRAGIRPPTGGGDAGYPERGWSYISYNLPDLIPGYNSMTYVTDPYDHPVGGVYGGRSGSYGWHGDENPLIPYQGKVYTIHSNALVAYGVYSGKPVSLPLAETMDYLDPSPPEYSSAQLGDLLSTEVEKMIQTGHLRPGFGSAGIFDSKGKICGDNLVDYWHHPADIIYTLLLALPHLPQELQGPTRNYIQAEFIAFPPYQYNHIGWRDGVAREVFDLPPEVESSMLGSGPQAKNYEFVGWEFAPHSFYSLWKYAEVFGGAKQIFDASKNQLEAPPSNSVLLEMPHVHNAYIAGYLGYLELEKLAGYPETTAIKNEFNRLLALRSANFSKDPPNAYFQEKSKYYCRVLNTARNFMYLTPELGQYLRDNAYEKVSQAVAEYERSAPYWFVSKVEVVLGEGVTNPLYDTSGIFQAKAWILGDPQEELTKYIDIPSVPFGDLFYIQNLVGAIQANSAH